MFVFCALFLSFSANSQKEVLLYLAADVQVCPFFANKNLPSALVRCLFDRILCQNIWAHLPLWVSDRICVVSPFQVVNSCARN